MTADEVPEISGVGNYALTVRSSDGKKDAFVLYCIDSNTYSTIKGVKGYDYIKRDQIDWYCKKSAEFTRNNGGEPVPSLAFFHIALPEFNQAASDENAQLYGIRREKACAPALNSGLFTAIKENGDVMGYLSAMIMMTIMRFAGMMFYWLTVVLPEVRRNTYICLTELV